MRGCEVVVFEDFFFLLGMSMTSSGHIFMSHVAFISEVLGF